MELEKVISSKKKSKVNNIQSKKIPEKSKLLKSLELIMPNEKENIHKIDEEMRDKNELLKKLKNENYSYILEIKIKAQIQLLERFIRVVYCRKNGIKRNDLEEKSILANEEKEYDIYRKHLKKNGLKNRIVKKKLIEIADKFIIGKELEIKELYEIFGMDE